MMQKLHWHSGWVRREHEWCVSANRAGCLERSRRYFATVSRWGDGSAWYGLMATLFVFGGGRGVQAALHMAVLGAVSLILYKVLKRWTRRPRPFAADGRIQAWVAPLDEFSFPSGHTLHAVGFTIIACAYFPLLALILVPFSVSVALSRVVLGLHYPSDVLAATAIGMSLASLTLWLTPGVTLF